MKNEENKTQTCNDKTEQRKEDKAKACQQAIQTLDSFIAEMLTRHENEFTCRTARPHLAQALQTLASNMPQPD